MNARRTQRRGLAWFALMALVAAVGCSSSTDGPPPEASDDLSQADTTKACGFLLVTAGQTIELSRTAPAP